MKQRVFNLIILDQSGSMYSIQRQAITGVNETIQTIREACKKHEDQGHLVTLVVFNTNEVKTIYDNVDADKVEELTSEQYHPACGTPLYDAMGNALTKLRKDVAENDIVLVTIITDGYENASREYNQQSIKALVEELKNKDWVFTYIGANQRAEEVGATISVTNTLNFSATVEGTKAMFAKEGKARGRFFDRISCNFGAKGKLSEDYFAGIDED